jgi:hypothetical protein
VNFIAEDVIDDAVGIRLAEHLAQVWMEAAGLLEEGHDALDIGVGERRQRVVQLFGRRGVVVARGHREV